ncbi:MAG: hypothetical protein DRG78_06335 [Epsilonproteobacteria bacterium]|nr:MAG: hypothetical protein DRG78_06335 [Campylobacterota bacterium]
MIIDNLIEESRKKASSDIEIHKQKLFEQYFTPIDIAKYMCSLFSKIDKKVELLDAGAGVGNLGAISSLHYLKHNSVNLTAVEWDTNLLKFINNNLSAIKAKYNNFSFNIDNTNFYNFSQKALLNKKQFNRIIINPPYSLTSKGTQEELLLLEKLDVHTPNAYSNFIELSYRLLDEDGELVAIVPRSFCNGTRFTKFRLKMLNEVKIEFIHSFESRKEVFKEYGIFQEVVIMKLTKKNIKKTTVCISDKLDHKKCEKFSFSKIIFKNDPYKFIHIPSKKDDKEILTKIYKLPSSLKKLGLTISTGKVVEYREPYLSNSKSDDSAVVIYQRNIKNGLLDLSIKGSSKQYLNRNELSSNKMILPGNYIVMKRMSYKENKERISSAILTKKYFTNKYITIENHLNYIHKDGQGFEKDLVIGLNSYLSSNILDKYIRRFNGHTQINASDIISLPMPSYGTLMNIGKLMRNKIITNEQDIENLLFKE